MTQLSQAKKRKKTKKTQKKQKSVGIRKKTLKNVGKIEEVLYAAKDS